MKLHINKWCPAPLFHYECTDEEGQEHLVVGLSRFGHAEALVGRDIECDRSFAYQEILEGARLVPLDETPVAAGA